MSIPREKNGKNEVVSGTLVQHIQKLEKCIMYCYQFRRRQYEVSQSHCQVLPASLSKSGVAHLCTEIILVTYTVRLLKNKPHMEISAWVHINMS